MVRETLNCLRPKESAQFSTYRVDEVAGHTAGDRDEYHPADPLDESPVGLGDVLQAVDGGLLEVLPRNLEYE